jgi:hypothetical protein
VIFIFYIYNRPSSGKKSNFLFFSSLRASHLNWSSEGERERKKNEICDTCDAEFESCVVSRGKKTDTTENKILSKNTNKEIPSMIIIYPIQCMKNEPKGVQLVFVTSNIA